MVLQNQLASELSIQQGLQVLVEGNLDELLFVEKLVKELYGESHDLHGSFGLIKVDKGDVIGAKGFAMEHPTELTKTDSFLFGQLKVFWPDLGHVELTLTAAPPWQQPDQQQHISTDHRDLDRDPQSQSVSSANYVTFGTDA